MYKTMHEKADATKTKPTPNSKSKPTIATAPTTRKTQALYSRVSQTKLNKTGLDLLCDVTTSLLVESAKLNRLGRYLSNNRGSRGTNKR